MSLVEQVRKVLDAPPDAETSDELRRLSDFYAEMTRLGFVKKQEYNLPLIDTIGRSVLRGTRYAVRERSSQTILRSP